MKAGILPRGFTDIHPGRVSMSTLADWAASKEPKVAFGMQVLRAVVPNLTAYNIGL